MFAAFIAVTFFQSQIKYVRRLRGMCANAFVIVNRMESELSPCILILLGFVHVPNTPVTYTRAQTQAFEVHEVVHEALVR